MNTPRHDNAADTHEWTAQEEALSTPVRRADALLARALRTQPLSQPPADFAAAVARMARQASPLAAREEPKLDRVLLNLLVAVFAVSAVVVVALYGSTWLAMSGEAIGRNATQWLLAGSACLGLSWAFGGARRLFEATHADASA